MRMVMWAPAAMSGGMEERIAWLEREVADLSEVVARQDGEIRELRALVERVREAVRPEPEGGVVLGDERPPHW